MTVKILKRIRFFLKKYISHFVSHQESLFDKYKLLVVVLVYCITY